MEDKKDINKVDKNGKNPARLKDEAKVGLIVSISAAIFFGGIITIASLQKGPTPNNSQTPSVSTPVGDVSVSTSDDPVVEIPDPMLELVEHPYVGTVSVARTFYDNQDDAATRLTALVTLPGEEGVYSKSFGVDYKANQKFDVEASFSGTVLKKLNDAIYGNVIHIKHDSGVVSVYASLGEVRVNEGQTVKQGDVIGSSGESLYNSTFGQSLHFELKNANNEFVNPNKSFGRLVKDL